MIDKPKIQMINSSSGYPGNRDWENRISAYPDHLVPVNQITGYTHEILDLII